MSGKNVVKTKSILSMVQINAYNKIFYSLVQIKRSIIIILTLLAVKYSECFSK